VKSGLSCRQGERKEARPPTWFQRPSDKKATRVLDMHAEDLSYRLIGRNLWLSKNTVMDIVRRDAAA
jgi:putative DNA-invertase from lambdoid prophage Rac